MVSSAQKSSGVNWCRRRVRFNEVPGEGSEGSAGGGFGAEPGHVQQGSGGGSGEGLGGFGAEPGQVQQGSVCTKKPPGTFSGSFSGTLLNLAWICTKASQTGFRRRFQALGGFGAARSGSTGFRRRFQLLASQHASERFVKSKRCGCWGYHRSLFHWFARGGGLEVLALQGHVTQPFPSRKRRPWLLNHVPLCWDTHRTTER